MPPVIGEQRQYGFEQPLIDEVDADSTGEDAGRGLARRLLHQVFLGPFEAERQRRQRVGNEIDP